MDYEIKDNANVRLAAELAQARERLKMTQKELGAASGIHQADISRIERGLGNPSLDTIVRLASAMKCRVNIEFAPEIDYAGILNGSDPGAELIDGVIYEGKARDFAVRDVAGALYGILSDFLEENKGEFGECEVREYPFAVREGAEDVVRSCVRPDVLINRRDETKNMATENRYTCDAPLYVCEVASGDKREVCLSVKKELYRRLNVREYWVLDPEEKRLTVYKLENDYEDPEIITGDEKASVGIFEGKLSVNLKGLWRFMH